MSLKTCSNVTLGKVIKFLFYESVSEREALQVRLALIYLRKKQVQLEGYPACLQSLRLCLSEVNERQRALKSA